MDSNSDACTDPGYLSGLNIDTPPPFCREGEVLKGSGTINKTPFLDNQKDVSQDLSWLAEKGLDKLGAGYSALCDPQQTGYIRNEQGGALPNRNVVYRYAQSLRGTDEAMKDMFSDIIVIDDNGKAHNVPIFWGTQERAVAFIVAENTRKDDSTVVERVKLPLIAIHASDYNFNQDRYVYHKAIDYLRSPATNWKPGFTTKERYERDTVFGVSRGIPVDISYNLYVWTTFEEDLNQILTQVITKFSPMAYIRVKGISWEIGVRLNSIANNINFEPGDKKSRVLKYQFGLTAETFVAQPIVRKKAVLKTRIEITDSIQDDNIAEVLSRLEEAVKEFEQS